MQEVKHIANVEVDWNAKYKVPKIDFHNRGGFIVNTIKLFDMDYQTFCAMLVGFEMEIKHPPRTPRMYHARKSYDDSHEERVTFNGHLYELMEGKNHYNNAKGFTHHRHGRVLAIESQAENDFIHKWIKKKKRNVWLAATDEGDEGNWRWEMGLHEGHVFWRNHNESDKPERKKYSDLEKREILMKRKSEEPFDYKSDKVYQSISSMDYIHDNHIHGVEDMGRPEGNAFVNWADGEPNNKGHHERSHGQEHCANVHWDTGKWYDTSCDSKQFLIVEYFHPDKKVKGFHEEL